MKHYLTLALAFSLIACMGKEDDITAQNANPSGTGASSNLPGDIILTTQSAAKAGLGKVSLDVSDSSAFDFNLGTARSSVQRFFIIKNVGGHGVQHIRLTTDNPAFYFSPSEISLLPAGNDSSAEQVIVLNVIHGVNLNGVGTAPLLPAGDNTANVSITASTTDSLGDTLSLSKQGQLNVVADVMDIAAFDDSTPIDLSRPDGNAMGPGIPVSQFIPYYAVSSGICRIVNTGNVDIIVRNWSGLLNVAGGTIVDSATLAPGDVYSAVVHNATGDYGSLQIDGQGVISDPVKLREVNDGRIFLRFQTPIHGP